MNLNIQKAHKDILKNPVKSENVLLPAPMHSGMFLHVSCRHKFCRDFRFCIGFIFSSQAYNIHILQKGFPDQWQKKKEEGEV